MRKLPINSCLSLFVTLLLMAGSSHAQVVATVANLSGVLTVRHADGKTKLLAVKSQIEQGDTLITENNTFARLKFTDASEIVLRPGTEVRVDKFSFDQNKPEGDSLIINMIKGGMRSVSGLIGKRNRDVVQYVTPTATIGIRGTTWDAYQVEPGTGSKDAAAEKSDQQREPGLYVSVVDGKIVMSNAAGASNFTAGQFGFVPNAASLPVILPTNPGIKFSPPPAFTSAKSGVSKQSDKSAAASDCAVR